MFFQVSVVQGRCAVRRIVQACRS